MRVRVLEPYILTPADRRTAVAFQPGEFTTKREWGEALVAAGVAEEIEVPARTEDADKA